MREGKGLMGDIDRLPMLNESSLVLALIAERKNKLVNQLRENPIVTRLINREFFKIFPPNFQIFVFSEKPSARSSFHVVIQSDEEKGGCFLPACYRTFVAIISQQFPSNKTTFP
jgi:hypothetical protein